MMKAFFFSCVHSPFEDKRALGLAIKAAKYIKPDALFNIGDFADCYAISSHDRDPARLQEHRFIDEINHAQLIRAEWDKVKAERKEYIQGNHEDRFRRFIWRKAPELAGYAPTISEALGMESNGWNVTPYKQYVRVGKLLVTHDIGFYGVYSVRATLQATGCSTVFGHTHRIGYRIEGDGTGKRRVGATIGWLGDYSRIDYEYRWKIARDWTHGFAYALIDDRTGIAHVVPVPIVNYRCVIGTKVIEG